MAFSKEGAFFINATPPVLVLPATTSTPDATVIRVALASAVARVSLAFTVPNTTATAATGTATYALTFLGEPLPRPQLPWDSCPANELPQLLADCFAAATNASAGQGQQQQLVQQCMMAEDAQPAVLNCVIPPIRSAGTSG